MKLAHRTVLAGVLSVTLVMGSAGFFVVTKTKDNLLETVRRELAGDLVFAASRVKAAREHVAQAARAIALNRAIGSTLDSSDSRGVNQLLNDLTASYPFINYVMVTEPDGRVFAVSTRDSDGRRTPTAQLLRKSTRENPMLTAPRGGDIAFGAPGHDPYLPLIGMHRQFSQWVSMPIAREGRTIGWTILSVDWRAIQSRVLQSTFEDLKSTGDPVVAALLTSERGTVLAGYPDRGTASADSAIGHTYEPDGAVFWDEIAVPFGPMNGNIIITYDRQSALQPVSDITRSIVAAAIISGLILGGLLYALLRLGVLNRIDALYRGSEAIGNGELQHRVPDLGADEIGQLGRAFNAMVNNLDKSMTSIHRLDHEVAERELALASLAEQEFALDQHAIVTITDSDGTITCVNDKFCEISGYSRDEIIGHNHNMFKSGEHDTAHYQEMYDRITSGKVWHGEICNRAKDGTRYWVDTTIVPFMGADGKPRSFIVIRTDITRQKQVEFALQEAKETAESANRAKSEFLANMSHEIRTPMNGVIGMTSLLLDSELSDQQFARARTIKRSAESLLGIINDILDFSKIEAGKLDLEVIDFDLGTLMQDVAATLAYRAEEKGLELICPANLLRHQWFQGDPGRIRQILTNLIGNAVKFTEDGEVSVRYACSDQHDGHSRLRFSVTDTGIGVDADLQAQLFDRFTQADGSTTRKYGGTGLGLSISRQLVEMMNGQIGVDSPPAGGSTFWFTVELADSDTQVPPRQSVDLRGQRVLAVDDNTTNLQLLDEVLSAWRVDHELAPSGPAALQALYDASGARKPFTIALIDMQMPGMDGARLGAMIRNDPTLPATRLVLLTSQGRRGDARKMYDAGFAGYLSKPINQSELYNALLQVAEIEDGGDPRLVTRYTAREQPRFRARLLLVEDNFTNQAVAQGMLSKFGVHADLAANGKEALRALKDLPYDLVLMDCQMPVMDGYDATRAIRAPRSRVLNPGIPVIAMTANAMQGDREKCLDAGMDGYIPKPVDPGMLREALEQWLPDGCQLGVEPIGAETRPQPAPAPASHDEPIFDHAAIRTRLMGDDALVRSVAEAFLPDMSAQIGELKLAMSSDAEELATAQAHKIKGAAANIGGMALSAQAARIEQAGKSGEFELARRELPQLEQRFNQLQSAMEEMLF